MSAAAATGIATRPEPISALVTWAAAAAIVALVPLAHLVARPRRHPHHALVGPQTAPPEGLPAVTAGALALGRTTPRHLVAGLVDLAGRGHLRIDEDDRDGVPVWTLVRWSDPDHPDLAPHEATLLEGLFAGRDHVRLDELDAGVAPTVKRAGREVLADLMARGWYRRRPDLQRSALTTFGVGLMVAGAATSGYLASAGAFAIALAAIAAGAGITVIAHAVHPLTTKGEVMRRRVRAYRTHLETIGPPPPDPAGGDELVTQLPYAIALGLDHRWAPRLTELTARSATGPGHGGGATGYPRFVRHLAEFSTTAAGAMVRTPPGHDRGFLRPPAEPPHAGGAGGGERGGQGDGARTGPSPRPP